VLFWVIAAAMLAACLAFLLVPLFRKPAHVEGRLGHEVAIYRDQLAEIGREVERGTISAADAKAAELEVSRRLLAADRARDQVFEPVRQSSSSLRLAASITILLPAATIGLYLALGAPQSPDLGLQPQAASLASLPEHQDTDLGQAVERLAARLQANPGDLDGWVLLARSKVVIGRFGDAAEAYEAALGLADDADAHGRLAQGKRRLDGRSALGGDLAQLFLDRHRGGGAGGWLLVLRLLLFFVFLLGQ